MRLCNGAKAPALNIDAAGKQDPLCDKEGDAQQGRPKGRETRQYAKKESEGTQEFDEGVSPSKKTAREPGSSS